MRKWALIIISSAILMTSIGCNKGVEEGYDKGRDNQTKKADNMMKNADE